MNWRLWSFRN